MRSENKLKILEFLDNSVESIGNLLFFFSLPYGTSFSRAKYLLRKEKERRERLKIADEKRRNFYTLISRLKKDGLIEKNKNKNEIFIKLTAKGKSILKILQAQKHNDLPNKRYETQEETTFKIITFDIPEKQRKKRKWLRDSLRELKFEMLQKSVWIGKTKLPEEFISDLNRAKILSYIEIFEITKSGSIKHIE